MNWDKLAKLALEQSAAFLLGLLVAYLIAPDSVGGWLLLILCTVAIFNVVRQIFAWRKHRIADRPS